MFCKIYIKYVVGLCLILKCSCNFNCPTSIWTTYKAIVKGTWLFKIRDTEPNESITITIIQTIEYFCNRQQSNEFSVLLNTERYSLFDASDSVFETHRFGIFYLESCTNLNCNIIKNITANVLHQTREWESNWNRWSEWSTDYEYLGTFYYLNKNCSRLYWTSWIESSGCAISSQSNYIRSCVDCDRGEVDQKFCEGPLAKQEDCNHFWSNWVDELCVIVGCNVTGEQIRRRQCLYGDGNETADHRLCSNQSALLKEQCISNSTLSPDCLADSNTCLYVGIGIAIPMFVIVCILIALLGYSHIKSKNTPEVHKTSHGFEPSIPEQREVSAEPNKQTVESNVYELDETNLSSTNKYTLAEQPDISQAFARQQPTPTLSNIYEVEQTNASNEPESIIRDVSVVEKSASKSEATCSTIQKHGNLPEQSNVYSTLDKPNQLPENDYSVLGPR